MPDSDLTAFARAEIQMRFAVPLLRDLQAELGEEVVLDALRARLQRRIANAAAKARPPADLRERHPRMLADFAAFAAGDTLDWDVIASDAERLDIDVTTCAYAQLMADLDASDLGSLLLCAEDDVAAARGGIRLERTQTRMQGAPSCDFRFRRSPVDAT